MPRGRKAAKAEQGGDNLNDIELNIEHADPHIEKRLQAVAELVARKLSYRKIWLSLAEKKVLNPETGQPYSLGTIFNDVVQLKKEWRERRNITIDEWLDEELASLDQLEQKAWARNNLELVLKIKTRRARYLGIDAPTKIEASGNNGGPIPLLVIYDDVKPRRSDDSDTG